MNYLLNNEQKMTEIVFANRNKNYGAYEIRSSYGITMLKSLSAAGSACISIFALAFFFSNKEPDQQSTSPVFIHDSVYIVKYGEEPPEKPAKKPDEPSSAKPENKNENQNSTLVVDSASSVIASTVAASNHSLATSDIIEPGGKGSSPGAVDSTAGTGTKTSKLGSDIKGGYEVDSQPEFEGGLKALYRFVATHTRYPEIASELNKGGTVYVKFVVDEAGKVGSLSLLNNVGYGMDEEALRVVGLIPKFKSPAMAAGHPVKMYYQLPINFRVR
jgi:protein TonB